MIRTILLLLMLMAFTGCSEFAILMSGSSLAISQNTYAKVYNGIDVLTIMRTEKSIKGHAYDSAKNTILGSFHWCGTYGKLHSPNISFQKKNLLKWYSRIRCIPKNKMWRQFERVSSWILIKIWYYVFPNCI